MPTKRRVSDRKQLGRNPLKFTGLTQSEIAYLAGYADGEGCFSIANGSTILIGVESCYPKAIYRYYKLFGGYFARYDRKKRKAQWRPCFRWRVFSERAYLAIKTLLPFLCEKKRQAELCLKFYDTKDPRKRVAINNKIKELKKLTYL